MNAAMPPLFFTRGSQKDNGLIPLLTAHNKRHLQQQGNARGVVIGSRSKTEAIIGVDGAGVVMGGDYNCPGMGAIAGQGSDDILLWVADAVLV